MAENSISALQAAQARGLGVECDVRLSADGRPYVFHDAGLERLTGQPGRFDCLSGAEIDSLRLRDGSAVPSLERFLTEAGANTPVLVEIKSGRAMPLRLCRAVAAVLRRHPGAVAAMSFDPRIVTWFAARHRTMPRGLVLSRRGRAGRALLRGEALDIARARPHFLARDIRDLPLPDVRRSHPRLPLLCWTVRTGAERLRARRAGAQIIFERP